MAEKLRVGLIGAGNMGRSHSQGWKLTPNGQITAVCDADEKRGRDLATELGVPWFSDYKELVNGSTIDAVSIATPPFLHREVAIGAAQAGKHVFVEKPMAVEVDECERMIEAAEKAGVTLMVGQVLRFLSPFAKVLELIQAGSIGKPISASVVRISNAVGRDWSAPWRAKTALSGGMLLEINAHELDLLRCIGGDVASVYAAGGNYLHPDADYPDIAFVSLNFASGAVGSLYSSLASSLSETSGHVQGDEGTIRYNGWGTRGTLEWRRFDQEQPTVIALDTVQLPPGVAYELEQFAKAVQTRSAPVVPGLDGLKVVEIAHAAYESARTGRSIKLPKRV